MTEDGAAYIAEATKLQSKSLIVGGNSGRQCDFCSYCVGHSDYEKVAVQEFKQKVSPSHTSFELKFTGLHVNPKFPYLGASPDGLVSCECCGEGLLEIECPYSNRHTSPTSADMPRDFYLKLDNE